MRRNCRTSTKSWWLVCRKQTNTERMKTLPPCPLRELSIRTNKIANGDMLKPTRIRQHVFINIRKAEHFIAFLRRFIEYLKVRYYDHNLSHNLMSDSNESLACCGLCSKSTDQYGMQEELSSDSLKRSLLDESDFFEMREE
jgi:hypothetical protein